MASKRLHGTQTRYRHGPDEDDQPGQGCRCGPCTTAATKAVNLHRLQRISGVPSQKVPAGPVREHVLALNAAGLPFTTIAAMAGVSIGVVDRLMHGAPAAGQPPAKRLYRTNAEALLAVRAGGRVDAGVFTLAVGSQRRLRALAWRGWPARYVAPRIPLVDEYVRRLMAGNVGPRVTTETANRIRLMFAELWTVDPVEAGVAPAKASQLRTMSARRGWVSALAWDDIDDPEAVPVVGEHPQHMVTIGRYGDHLIRGKGLSCEEAAGRLRVRVGFLRVAIGRAKQAAQAVNA